MVAIGSINWRRFQISDFKVKSEDKGNGFLSKKGLQTCCLQAFFVVNTEGVLEIYFKWRSCAFKNFNEINITLK